MQSNEIFFGRIEVICGSMFSGKTEELIRRLKRAKIANLKVEIFKPKQDNRYSDDSIVSHDNQSIKSLVVTSSKEVYKLSKDYEVIGIDEAQFFDDGIVEVVNTLADEGKRVIIAGLDMDYRGVPFGPMPELMAIADDVTKVHAVCMQCGNPALYSKRIVSDENQILIGEKKEYEPRCRKCNII